MSLIWRWCVLMVVLTMTLSRSPAQMWEVRAPEYTGIRVSGPLRGGVPAMVMGQRLWFVLDGFHVQPRDLRVEVVHCDRDWQPTRSEFVNDPFLMRGKKPIPSSAAATGIRSYRWSYASSIPSGVGLEPFRFSGNYIANIIDLDTETIVATFRFVVAESVQDRNIAVRRRRLPMKISPWDEAHAVSIRIDERSLGQESGDLFLQSVRVVDIYKNREWSYPVRIDLNDLTPTTWIDGLGTSVVSFTAGAVMPGNEYRVLDIRDVDTYPVSSVLRSRGGADVSRFFVSPTPDHNGVSVIVGSRTHADYERFEFQVWWEADRDPGPIYVVGDFNGWEKDPDWMLTQNGLQGRYSLSALLKRGRYDYQYIVGHDPYALEGNSWSTSNLYTGIVYYSDTSLGGYDRILFISQTESRGDSGSQEEESR